jgi:hypothetical protein
MKAFLHFIRQDYSFLFHYARTNALAAYKAKNYDDLAGAAYIVQTVLDEVKMHVQVSFMPRISGREAIAQQFCFVSFAKHKGSVKRCWKPRKRVCPISHTTDTCWTYPILEIYSTCGLQLLPVYWDTARSDNGWSVNQMVR